jgi:2-polyprenyl-3-methyl-5-hydroxy-6-metoxy-1,4-benzoquinol methylase
MKNIPRKTTNHENISAWSVYPQHEIEAFGDNGDLSRQYLLNRHIFQLLGEVQNKNILDAGSGTGYLSRKLANLKAQVTAIEPSETMFAYAHSREQHEQLGITYHQQDLSTWKPQQNQFDIVVSNMVLMDIPDWQSALDNCVTALKPQGKLIISISHPCFENPSSEYNQNGNIAISEYFQEYEKPLTYGVSIHRTLSTYVNYILQLGCTITRIIEPQIVDQGAPNELEKDKHIPSFLVIHGQKLT